MIEWLRRQICFENDVCHAEISFLWSSNSYKLLHKILDDAPQIFNGKITDEKPEVFITSESPAEESSRSTLPYIMLLENESSRNFVLAAQPPNKDHRNIHVDTYPVHLVWKLMTKTERLLCQSGSKV